MELNNQAVQLHETKPVNWEEALQNEYWITPQADIYETRDEYVLTINMPGVTKENVRIKLEDGNMVIMGKIDYYSTMNKKYILNESQLGNFYRKFRISDNIDDSKIEASLENGQLTVNMPKHERLKPKDIQIK